MEAETKKKKSAHREFDTIKKKNPNNSYPLIIYFICWTHFFFGVWAKKAGHTLFWLFLLFILWTINLSIVYAWGPINHKWAP